MQLEEYMDYEEALQYIHSTRRFGAVLGLQRIQKMLDLLDNPQEKLKVIHVAGTNGKGSTCAYVASILQAEGYKVGLYSSPAILCFNERIQINRNYISNDDLAIYVQKIKEAVIIMQRQGLEHPTEFEIVTSLALLYFAEKEVDFVVLEVGLGGRFDATNVISQPLVSIITSIGMDHTDVLGDTLEKIAYEKCGIIKQNCPVVVHHQKQNAYKVIVEQIKDKAASSFYLKDAKCSLLEKGLDKQKFDFEYKEYKYQDIEISMIGDYQIHNAATALLGVIALQSRGVIISQDAIYKGMSLAYWPGRFEVLSKEPFLIIDGAHNEDGAHALQLALHQFKKDHRIILVLGILGDKDYQKILEQFVKVADEILVSEVRDNPRALPKDKLFDAVQKIHNNVSVLNSLEHFLAVNLQHLPKDTLVCCAGSLYFISEIKRLYNHEERLL